MNSPLPGDYIDIHTHGSGIIAGIFAIENLMAHEERRPVDVSDQPCTYGIHPWHLERESILRLIDNVQSVSSSSNLLAIGEAGFDKLRGADMEIQSEAFIAQVKISESIGKPLFIHCVRAWDELLPVHKRMRPKMPWLIHGFRGSVELAGQLLSKGMFLSFWFDFVLRPESSNLLRSLPSERIFLETDGADVGISIIYEKVADDLNMEVDELKSLILKNYYTLFSIDQPYLQ
ncbi:MAG: TatD family hydrolase [Bacteroidales bacterium]|nr:TatD family hydrolase [Bacteroidales bacterium]